MGPTQAGKTGHTGKERSNMVKARIAARLTQKEVAAVMKVNIASIVNWEKAHTTPQLYQITELREAIHFTGTDEELLQVFEKPVEESVGISEPKPCETVSTRDILDSSMSVQESEEEQLSMDKGRRKINGTIAAGIGVVLVPTTLVTTTQIVTGPVIEPDEYLSQCRIVIDDCWEWLNQGMYHKIERALRVHVPTLRRLATTISTYQDSAASLAVQAKAIQINLATHNLDYATRKDHCVEAIRFGRNSDNPSAFAVTQAWLGNTYIFCYHQPKKAIPLLNEALSSLDNEATQARKDIQLQQRKRSRVYVPSLSRSAISIDLSIAYAQDKDETSATENETKALEYAEQSQMTIPKHPELDSLYPCLIGSAERDQLEGKMYLYLAERFPNKGYAKIAYDVFDKATSKQAMNQAFLGQAYIRKADAARAIGDMGECVRCLTQGLLIGLEINSLKRIIEAHDAVQRVPKNWQKEDAVQQLQKDVSHALVVARR